jgi:hypothetical protein
MHVRWYVVCSYKKRHSYLLRIKKDIHSSYKRFFFFSFYLFTGKKPLEITVRTADHSHLYTSGIIPPKLPSTPTTDITDELNEREPFDKPQTFRRTPEPYLGDSRDNNEADTEDSDSMFGVREHNRERLAERQAKSKKVRDSGTQVEEKSTRTIGTMSETISTRNAGNEVQPQSSATQTSNLFRQQQEEEDDIDFQQTTSQQFRHDTKTNGYYPSQRSASVDRRKKYVPSSSIVPQHIDRLDYDQYRPRHRSQYHDDPRDQYISPQDDYQPYPSSRTRHRRPSPTSPPHTPPPPVEYRSTPPYDRERTPSPSDHHRLPPTQRSRSPPAKKHVSKSTSQHTSVSPPSQRRSRPPQRSTSPPTSKHHISSSPHRTPSPPAGYRSPLPNDRHLTPKNYSYRPKIQSTTPKVSVATDTSLDKMKHQHHRDQQSESPPTREFGTTTSADSINHHHKRRSYSDYQKLDSNPPKYQDHTKKPSYEDNYKSLRDNQPPSTRKNYRLRPETNDSHNNNYEEIPSKHDESNTPPYDRRRQGASPTTAQRSDEEEQYPKKTSKNEILHDNYIRELPTGGSVSIPSTTVIQPDSLPRSRGQNKSPAHRRITPELPLHHGQEQQTPPRRHSALLNFGSSHITHQSPFNEIATPFNIRYIQEPDNEFSTDNSNIRSSTLKRDALRSKAHRILLLPVLNSSRTYVFEKQSLPGRQMRQSRSNGNFYLATSPTLRSLNTSFHEDDPDIDPLTRIDSDNLSGHALRSQVA